MTVTRNTRARCACELPVAEQAGARRLLALRVRGAPRAAGAACRNWCSVQPRCGTAPIYHKDLLPVVYVTGDMAGKLDSPLYGMFNLVGKLRDTPRRRRHARRSTSSRSRPITSAFAIKWDGEWQITYETFRDMGIAYAVGLVLIYLLVVAQFRSYLVPLVIMAPIPLTVIGVMPGHALLGAQFTATSMIGMIALAGIIVRNSILLVDFINHAVAEGVALRDAVIEAAPCAPSPSC